ncbi:MAG TPA: LptA/OstA family protein, partial [Candidatus Udaeobacter sp.]
MKKLAVLILFIACATGARMEAQIAAEPTKASRAAPEKKAKKTATDKKTESPATKLFGQDGSNAPTTTEIYADEAFFDSTKNVGIFSGRVKVTDPRFNLQSDKLTVFITKGQNQGLEKAIAEGNV